MNRIISDAPHQNIRDRVRAALGYAFTAPNKIDEYDNGAFTYATFEIAVTVPSPASGQTVSDCFTITYEGESVNPCFDVIKAAREISIQAIPACVRTGTGDVRIVAVDDGCRAGEFRIQLAVLTPNSAPVALAPAPPRRQTK